MFAPHKLIQLYARNCNRSTTYHRLKMKMKVKMIMMMWLSSPDLAQSPCGNCPNKFQSVQSTVVTRNLKYVQTWWTITRKTMPSMQCTAVCAKNRLPVIVCPHLRNIIYLLTQMKNFHWILVTINQLNCRRYTNYKPFYTKEKFNLVLIDFYLWSRRNYYAAVVLWRKLTSSMT